MSVAVVAVEGVLAAKRSDNLAEAQPLPEALKLVEVMGAAWTMALISVEPNMELLKHWLKSNGVKYTYLYNPLGHQRHLDLLALRLQQLERIKAGGRYVGMYIESDPEAATAGPMLGIPTALMYQPLHTLSRFADVPSFRRWAEIVEDVEVQRLPPD